MSALLPKIVLNLITLVTLFVLDRRLNFES